MLEIVKKTIVCDKHGEYEANKIYEIFGEDRFSRCLFCINELKEEDDKRENTRLLRHRKEESHIPTRFLNKYFDSCEFFSEKQEKVIHIAKLFVESFHKCLNNGTNLIFSGRAGTGKTHLMCVIGNELMQNGYSTFFVSALQACQRIKGCYRDSLANERLKLMASFTTCDILLLDDAGVQFNTETDKLILYEIINARYENLKPMIVTTNLDRPTLTTCLHERVMSRLEEANSRHVIFDFESYRGRSISRNTEKTKSG